MDGFLHRRLAWLWKEDGTVIERKLFRVLALLAAAMSTFIVIPLNLAQNLPGFINLCMLAFGLGSILLFAATFRGYYGIRLLFFLLMANLDLTWFGKAGSHGSIGFFFFCAALYLVIFFRRLTRWVMLGLYLLNGVAILWVEWLHPDWVRSFASADSRYLNLMIGFVLSSVICVVIPWVVLEAYHRERRRLEASLTVQRQCEAQFQALLMNAPLPIFMANAEGRLVCANRSFQQILGYSLEDVPTAADWWEKAYPDAALRLQATTRWKEACAKAEADGTTVPPMEYEVTCKDGRIAQLEVQAAVVGDQWLVMLTDLSERRRGEAAIREAQKLEGLGVLAGGIAHDFNNLLSAMQGNLDLAQVKLPLGAASAPFIQNVENTILKAADLTRQMLSYSGNAPFVTVSLDLNRLVTEITHLLVVSISKKARLAFDLAPGLPLVEADSGQLQQVLMNLVTNASEALGDADGVITLATSLTVISPEKVETTFAGQGLESGEYVTLTVSDTGCGMESQVLDHLFDPIFSTKGTGRGLGLSALQGILRGHRAGLEIESSPGQGSAFQIHFRASATQVPEVGGLEPGAFKDRFHGQVLLVDDEAELRFSYSSMLQHLGFRVVAARDGQEAMERFTPGEFALVLMDLSMPRMDGKEAFFQMRARDAVVKVVLISGYCEQEALEPLKGLRPAAFIQKPFSLAALAGVLERAME